MARRKTTVYLDDEVLRATKVLAARTGRPEYAIVDEALRRFLGLDAVAAVWERSALSEDDALALAYSELRAMREGRDPDGGSRRAVGHTSPPSPSRGPPTPSRASCSIAATGASTSTTTPRWRSIRQASRL